MKNLLLLFILVVLVFSQQISSKKSPIDGFDNTFTIKIKTVWRGLGLNNPKCIVFIPGNPHLMIVAIPTGHIYLLRRISKTETLKRLLCDMSVFVDNVKNQGILDLIIDPLFLENGYIYIIYTSAGDVLQSILCRFRVNPLLPRKIDFLDRVEFLFVVNYPLKSANYGGKLYFDISHNLYVLLGSGSYYKYSPNRNPKFKNGDFFAQDTTNFLGKILKIDISIPRPFSEYSIPKDNPFVGKKFKKKVFLPEVYAYGFHNPISVNIDDETNEVYILDAGSGLKDEVNILEKGANYGWPYFEGDENLISTEENKFAKASIIFDAKNSIVGGLLYKGEGITQLLRYYVFADNKNNIYAVKFKDKKPLKKLFLGHFSKKILNLFEGEKGEIYILSANEIYILESLIGNQLDLLDLEEFNEK